jgi:formiminotetrahydrofolate cyclodeaminase
MDSAMNSSVWQSTLEEFRDRVGSRQPVPASGCVAAVSATLAINLLAKALEITSSKKSSTVESQKLKTLLDAARALATRLARYADEDVALFNAYLKSAKLPESNDQERHQREHTMAAAVRQVIEAPFDAARAASSGIQLSADAAAVVPKFLLADLGSAAALLGGAARGLILCAESNIRQLAASQETYRQTATQLQDLERAVARQEDAVRRQVTSRIAGEDR